MSNAEMIVKCLKFYTNFVTDEGKACPTVDQMREIVQIDDIIKGLEKKKE